MAEGVTGLKLPNLAEASQDPNAILNASVTNAPVQKPIELTDAVSAQAEEPDPEVHIDAQGAGKDARQKQNVERPSILATSDDEDDEEMGETIGIELYRGSSYTPLKDRTKKAKKRVLQQIEYSKLIEDRLVDLERRVTTVEGKGADDVSAIDTPSNEGDERRDETTILGLNRVSFEEYRPKKEDIENRSPIKYRGREHHKPDVSDTAPRSLIDVVVERRSAIDRIDHGAVAARMTGSEDPTVAADHAADNLGSIGDRYDTPDRIRINSALLLAALTEITSHGFRATSYSGGIMELKSQVILRPFKILVVYESEIRAYTKRLARKHGFCDNESSAQESAEATNGLASQVVHGHGATGLEPSNEPADFERVKVGDRPMTQTETRSMEEAERLESKRCLQELQILIELFDSDLKSTFDLRRQIDAGTLQSIAFPDLWHLFRHDDEIRTSEAHSQVFRVLDVIGGRRPLLSREEAGRYLPDSDSAGFVDTVAFTISCFYYVSDGKRLGTVQETFSIKSYNDLKSITSLPVFPLRSAHAKSGSLSRDDLIQRGRRYIELAGSNSDTVHKLYSGLTMNLEQFKEEVDSAVIIDTAMALLKNPSLEISYGVTSLPDRDRRETMEFLDPECRNEGCHENTAIHQDHEVDLELSKAVLKDTSSDWDPSETEKGMQDANYILCCRDVYGYVLRSRKWMSLDVMLVQDIKKHSGGFDSLVLPPGHRDTLLALVETHSKGNRPGAGNKSTERQVDLVRGKGKGLIILLHGEPGVGKTSTAECVAEHTGRPLFQVTCGDIGESAEAVERTLENHFQLAHKWGCVLLLDEADVFLMKRNKNDLNRNAIVSVFLRVLEYYSGILFLTTNRVGVFDPAFRSRIHMSFFYPKLSQGATAEIWRMNLDRAQKLWGDSIKLTSKDYAGILKYAQQHFNELELLKTTWNGRQIRNAFQTAIALAEYEAHQAQIKFGIPECPKPVLEVKHFEKVAEASKHFDEYLKLTAGGLEADEALRAHERMDEMNEEKIRDMIADQLKGAQRL